LEILKLVKERRSVRKYLPDPLPEGTVSELKEALVWAPSAGNLQSRKFYFVFDENKKTKIAQAALNQDFIATAPIVAVCCTDASIQSRYGKRGIELYTIQDVALSVQNYLLVAKDRGIGTTVVGAFDEERVSFILGLPSNLRPVMLVPTGYPDENPLPPHRIGINEAVTEIK
jgi:nitroreductase